MKLNSSRFGEIEIKEDLIIFFPEGIPGFQEFKRYAILKKEDNDMFAFLHSVENPNLMFIITNPYFITFDYEFKISDEDCNLLEIEKNNIHDLGVFSITKIDKNKNVFINLKAPVCINFKKKIGKQIILYNYNYSHQFKLEPEKILENYKKNLNLSKEQLERLHMNLELAVII